MRRERTVGLTLLTGLLAGCTMQGPAGLRVHEADLYGGSQDRVVWVYGSLNGPTSSLKLGGQTVDLRAQVSDPLGVPGSLSVNGAATFRAKTATTAPALNVVKTQNSFVVQASSDLSGVYYTDGSSWYSLGGALSGGSTATVSARPNTFLRGAGALSSAEADALGGALSHQGSLVVAVLKTPPEAAIGVEPAAEQQQTALYVLPNVIDASSQAQPQSIGNSAGTTTTSTTTTTTSSTTVTSASGGSVSTPTPPPFTGTVSVRELARGVNSAQNDSQASAVVSRGPSSLAQVWRVANGTVTPLPQVPSVDFSRGGVVTVFAGQRPTGGYGVRFVNARLQGTTLTITVDFTGPPAGSITTQSLTSPWLSLNVQGGFGTVVVQDVDGNTLSVSQDQ